MTVWEWVAVAWIIVVMLTTDVSVRWDAEGRLTEVHFRLVPLVFNWKRDEERQP